MRSPRNIAEQSERRTALVTGASGAIGGAIAEQLARAGFSLVLHGHRGKDRLRALTDRLAQLRPAIATQECLADLRDEPAVERLFAETLDQFGRLDVLVVNAGVWVSEPKPLDELSLEQWNDTLRADLTSAFLCCRAFFRHLRAEPREAANVVLIGSTAALFGEADHADYAAAKAGLVHGLLPSLKNEIVRLAPRGRVNAVCPGWVRTPMTEPWTLDPSCVDRATRTMALRKLASVDDVAHAVRFLADDALAGHLSGVVLPVAGGMEGRSLW